MLSIVALLIAFIGIVNAEVIVLTDDNFEHLTQAATGQTTGKWLVKFYAPWCGHCKRLEPVWNELSDTINEDDGILVAKVDCTQNPSLRKRFDITGFPTLKFFAERQMYDYGGSRSLMDILDYVEGGYKDGFSKDVPAPPSWFDEKMATLRKNVHMNALMNDLDEILSYRKNAAALLILLGVIIGATWGFVFGHLFTKTGSKVKKE